MAKMLTPEELYAVARQSNLPHLDEHVFRIQDAVAGLAEALGRHLDLSVGGTTLDTDGTFSAIYPVIDNQEMPEALKPFDPEGDWEPRLTPEQVAQLAGEDALADFRRGTAENPNLTPEELGFQAKGDPYAEMRRQAPENLTPEMRAQLLGEAQDEDEGIKI
jgi:hypothetical protein